MASTGSQTPPASPNADTPQGAASQEVLPAETPDVEDAPLTADAESQTTQDMPADEPDAPTPEIKLRAVDGSSIPVEVPPDDLLIFKAMRDALRGVEPLYFVVNRAARSLMDVAAERRYRNHNVPLVLGNDGFERFDGIPVYLDEHLVDDAPPAEPKPWTPYPAGPVTLRGVDIIDRRTHVERLNETGSGNPAHVPGLGIAHPRDDAPPK